MGVEEGTGRLAVASDEYTAPTKVWIVAVRWAALAILGWVLGWYSIVPAYDRGSVLGMYLSAALVVFVAITGLLIPVLRPLRPLCAFLIVGAVMATELFVDITQNGLLPA